MSLESERVKRKKQIPDTADETSEDERGQVHKKFAGTASQLPCSNGNNIKVNRKRKLIKAKSDVIPGKRSKFVYLNEKTVKPRQKRPNLKETAPSDTMTISDNYSDLWENVLTSDDYCNSDLFFIDEKKENYESFKKNDLGFYIFDEIALEGLDGITAQALWVRLNKVFPAAFNEEISELIWTLVKSNNLIKFFELPQERGELIAFDRFTFIDDDGIFLEPPIDIEDIYPFHAIHEKDKRGSCSSYSTRMPLKTEQSLKEVVKEYGSKLLMVADQCLRNKVLIHEEADPNSELMDPEYMVLERTGRARYHGEITQGKMSLQLLYSDSKTLHYIRRNLMQDFLIVNQNFSVLAPSKNLTGSVVHLTRFYTKRKNKQMVIMEQIASTLREKVDYQMPLSQLKQLFGRCTGIKKITKHKLFHRFFRIGTFNYRSLHPNAPKSEWKLKGSGKERKIRAVQLIDPHINICANFDKEQEEVLHKDKISLPSHKLALFDCLKNVYLFIHSTGPKGATVQEILEYVGTDFYSVRLVIRKLVSSRVLNTQKVNQGRQNTQTYYVKHFDESFYSEKKWQLDDNTLQRILNAYDALDTKDQILEHRIDSIESPIELAKLLYLNMQNLKCAHYLTTNEQQIEQILLQNSNLYEDLSSKIIYTFTLEKPSINFDNLFKPLPPNVDLKKVVQNKVDNFTFTVTFLNNSCPKFFYNNKRYDEEICKIFFLYALINNINISGKNIVNALKMFFEKIMEENGRIKKRQTEIKTENKEFQQVSENFVQLEKYMCNTVLVYNELSNNVKVEIFESTDSANVLKEKEVTERYLTREIKVLNYLQENHIEELFKLYNYLRDSEAIEGVTTTLCRKSLYTILARLAGDKSIKFYKVVLTSNNVVRKKTFVCLPMIDENNEIIKRSIEETKLRTFLPLVKIPKSVLAPAPSTSPFASVDVKNSIMEYKRLGSSKIKNPIKMVPSQRYAKKLGYKPKFVRMKILHEYLFYLTSVESDTEKLTEQQIYELFNNTGVTVNQNDVDNMPAIYCNEISWKMFIPPLPTHRDWPSGWILACDLILRLPLSVFVKLVAVQYDMPELNNYLEHKVKRHYLIKDLPTELLNILLHRRKYFSSLNETITYLCYAGLVQLGPQKFRDKAQLFIYMNKHGRLYDTTTSGPGYHQVEDIQYERLDFYFKKAIDVEQYWNEMWRICMNTPLGKKNVMEGKIITIEDANCKPVLQVALKAKTPESVSVYDTGNIPGDHKGAAGLDSSLWPHMRKNWVVKENKKGTVTQPTSLKTEKLEILSKPILYDELINSRKDSKIFLNKNKIKKKVTVTKWKEKKTRKIVRKIVVKKKPKKYHDKLDLMIMKANKQTRVDWDETEDRLLSFARAATVFLARSTTKQFITYKIIRDFMHRVYERSTNKSSKSIQRRLNLLLDINETTKVMEKNAENLLSSPIISKYFDKIYHRHTYRLRFTEAELGYAFIYLLNYMIRNKTEVELLLLGHIATMDFFSDQYIDLFEVLLEDIEPQRNLYVDPTSRTDIEKDNIKSIVHCSLNCKKYSPIWAYHVFSLYKKHPDKLMRESVFELKKGTLLSCNKKMGLNENIWHTPFKLSNSYQAMTYSPYKEKFFQETWQCFLTLSESENHKTNFFTCNELNSLHQKITYVFKVPEMGIILNPKITDHTELIEELSKRFHIYLNKIKDRQKSFEEVEEPVEQIDDSKIKTIVMNLIFRVPYLFEGHLEEYFKKLMNTSKAEINNYLSLIVAEIQNYIKTTNKEELEFLKNCHPIGDRNKLVNSLSRLVFAVQNLQLQVEKLTEENFIQWQTEEQLIIQEKPKTKKKKLLTSMDLCIKRAVQGDIPTIEEIKEGMMLKDGGARKIPHITDLTMLLTRERFPELDADEETIESLKQHFIMQCPKLANYSIDSFDELANYCKFKETCEKPSISSQYELQVDKYREHPDQEFIAYLIHYVKCKKELGASGPEIQQYFKHPQLEEIVNLLLSSNVILRLGISSITFVHYEYRSLWLMESQSFIAEELQMLHENENIDKLKASLEQRFKNAKLVRLMPWTDLDGHLNNELHTKWISLITGYCMENPDIFFRDICRQFCYIKPVDIYYLIEELKKTGCLEIMKFEDEVCDLFSTRNTLVEKKAGVLDDLDRIFIRIMNTTCLRTGCYLSK